MKQMMSRVLAAAVMLGVAAPAWAQLGMLGKVAKTAKTIADLNISEQDEYEIGAMVSEKIRQRYGVVQDKSVHRYVTLVGATLATRSSRPNIKWQFIVLDTDGVNAFAAPGGFVHITRGALALLDDEAELAGVLGHEIIHITEQHTIKAIKKSKMTDLGIEAGAAQAPGGGLGQAAMEKIAGKAAEMVMAGFGRGEELESDNKGIAIANEAGYQPLGLSGFLMRLQERNKASEEKQGLFASHPEMKERLDKLASRAKGLSPAGTATLAERYSKFIAYEPKPITEVAQVEAGAAGLAGGGKTGDKSATAGTKEEEKPKKRGFGLGNLLKPGGEEKKSAQVTGSGGSRGVDTERNAKGGSNPALVAVNITAADIAAFKKEGQLK